MSEPTGYKRWVLFVATLFTAVGLAVWTIKPYTEDSWEEKKAAEELNQAESKSCTTDKECDIVPAICRACDCPADGTPSKADCNLSTVQQENCHVACTLTPHCVAGRCTYEK